MAPRFDGLADDYDHHRPRYPVAVARAIADRVTRRRPHVIDTGAGTGIFLESLLPLLPTDTIVDAVDVSADMVALGKAKLPSVGWHVGGAEAFLEAASDVDLVVAAQAYQWMDRPHYLRAARRCLGEGGVVAITQNNRDFDASAFLDAYEALLEELSPGYSRYYRSFDVVAELAPVFSDVEVVRAAWTRTMPVTDFVGMARSSTQAQRAITAHGDAFVTRLEALLRDHEDDGQVEVAYQSEAFIASS